MALRRGGAAGTSDLIVYVARSRLVRDLGFRIRWAWVPAGIFVLVVSWTRRGWWTLLLIVLGLALGAYVNWRAARRRR